MHNFRPDVVPGRREAAEARLELVGAQHHWRRDADGEQERNSDHPSAAGDGIDPSGQQSAGEQQRVHPVGHVEGHRRRSILLPSMITTNSPFISWCPSGRYSPAAVA